MNITSTMAKAAAFTVTAVAATVLSSGAAFAGTNGQQIQFHDRQHLANSVLLQGYNQNGQWAQGCFQTPYTDTDISGWWWKGEVEVTAFTRSDCTGNVVIDFYTDVPTDWSSDYWFASD
ncbi:hypothetical protein [Streptacidiphilus melanogenes]|uniref:hypothetical protein n=1 Tax=Streptacidiphilus melanogenes TaxID=411235 RepID=UPI000694B27A|nr:hypothetical protein [Streptacidiphilus melanogenes]